MYIFLFVIIFIALFYYIVIVKNGNLSFWKKVKENPDFFYEKILENDSWLIDDGSMDIDKKKFDGPFHFFIPKIQKTIKFYGKIGSYEESQEGIIKEIDRLKKIKHE